MSEVFYRKWRPRRLDEVVGQEAVTRALLNAVVLGRTAHSYLFCGPRGTGKTSTARIMAKAVNCLSQADGEPDNKCDICKSIDDGRSLDLIEIDAASNRGIDDIRELRERVNFLPNEAKYKVYIIDEAHMLTEPAFNALLKTLEEPPAHAIFVLATTEAHKIPLTIISRCQRFDFRRITMDRIVARLSALCVDEGVEAEQEALETIARTASGSLRDAENLLEQAFISYGSPLSAAHISDLLDLGSSGHALEFAGHVVDKATGEGIKVINQVADEGADLVQFRRVFMGYLRGVLLAKSGYSENLGYPEETMQIIRSMSDRCNLGHLVRSLKGFADIEIHADRSSPLGLELAMVDSALGEGVDISLEKGPEAKLKIQGAVGKDTQILDPLSGLSKPVESQGFVKPINSTKNRKDFQEVRPREAKPEHQQEQEPVPEKPFPTEPSGRLDALWDDIVKSLRTRKGKRFNLGALLRASTERVVNDTTITIRYTHPSHQDRMQQELDDPQSKKIIFDAVSEAMKAPYEVQATVTEENPTKLKQKVFKNSHLVRAAQAMGARIVEEKEE